VCKFTADGSTIAADAPCLPNSYLQGTTCTPRVAIGQVCDSDERNCVNNAECITVGSSSTCVEVYSVAAGGSCDGFDDVCVDELVCNDQNQCAELANHLVTGCTVATTNSFCGDDENYACICNYASGEGRCYGLYNRIGAAYRAWASCMVTNNCDTDETFYYGSCGDNNCFSQWDSLVRAEEQEAQDFRDASGDGIRVAAALALVALLASLSL
jgi:hypothetical protein